MDAKQKYTKVKKVNRITLSIDFINQLEKYEDVHWEQIIEMVERMHNHLTEAGSLGHVFHDEDTNEPVFIEFYFEMRPKGEYLFEWMGS